MSVSLDVACLLPQVPAHLHAAATAKVSLRLLRTAHSLAAQLRNHLDVCAVQAQLELVDLDRSD